MSAMKSLLQRMLRTTAAKNKATSLNRCCTTQRTRCTALQLQRGSHCKLLSRACAPLRLNPSRSRPAKRRRASRPLRSDPTSAEGSEPPPSPIQLAAANIWAMPEAQQLVRFTARCADPKNQVRMSRVACGRRCAVAALMYAYSSTVQSRKLRARGAERTILHHPLVAQHVGVGAPGSTKQPSLTATVSTAATDSCSLGGLLLVV